MGFDFCYLSDASAKHWQRPLAPHPVLLPLWRAGPCTDYGNGLRSKLGETAAADTAEKLKGKAFWINEFICLCILLTISIIMLVHGIRLCNLFKSWHLSSMFNVSRIWLWLCLPISGATSTLYVLEAFAKFIDDPSTRAIKNEADKLLEQTESEDNRP